MSEVPNQQTVDHKVESPTSADHKIAQLEKEVQSLRSNLQEPGKESFIKSNSSLFISIIAITTSVAFSLYGIFKENRIEDEQQIKAIQITKEERIKKIEELTISLSELYERYAKLSSEPNIDENTINSYLTYNKLIYINKIIALIDGFNDDLPPALFSLIGYELKQQEQNKKALDFFYLELKNSKTAIAKINAYRDLALAYGVNNSENYNPDSSYHYRILSIQFSDRIYGEQKFSYKGYSYYQWASNEFYNGNTTLAKSLADSAKNQYALMQDNNNQKNYYLKLLSRLLESENRKYLNKVFVNLSGEWNTPGTSKTKAHLHFYQNATVWMCSLELYDSEKISTNFTGTLISTTDRYMTFSLQGMKKLSDREFVSGSSAILRVSRINNYDNQLDVTLNDLYSNPLLFRIYKK